jgi:septum formation protein
MNARLVLASRSPRRRALLEEAGYSFVVLETDFREPPPRLGESPGAYALRAARGKAEEASKVLAREGRRGEVVLAADTVVDLAGEMLGKPADDADARAMLQRMAGSSHAVVSAVVLREAGTGRSVEGLERTELEMLPMTPSQIDDYVASGESRGKAGAYAIQETGDRFVRVRAGSLTNVVGLPMERVARMVRAFAPALAPRRSVQLD